MWLGVLVGALSLSLAVGSPHGNRSDVSNLIFGGVAQDQPFPPLVQLFDRGSAFCGGTILNKQHILTAAHCTETVSFEKITVYAGLAHLADTDHPEVQAMTVNRTIVHPHWNKEKRLNDIAILVLNENINYTSKIQPIEIIAFDFVTDVRNQNVSIYGFGSTKYTPGRRPKRDNLLYKADTTIVPRLECASQWLNASTPRHIITEQICTDSKTRGALHGDSGGPVIYFMENLLTKQLTIRQVGIVSYGNPENNSFPDIHTRASTYCTWITQETKLAYWCS